MAQYSQVRSIQKAEGTESYVGEPVGGSEPNLTSKTQAPPPPHPVPGGLVSNKSTAGITAKGVVSSQEVPSAAADSGPAKPLVHGLEPVENYEPPDDVLLLSQESDTFEEPFSLYDACVLTREAQEIVIGTILNSQIPKPQEAEGLEKWYPGKNIKKTRKWWRNRPKLVDWFESATLSNGADRSVLEVVNGVDDRVLIEGTTAGPWSGIVQLNIVAGNGQRVVGSGWLIAPKTVITAGHCVYMHDAGGWAREITAAAGRNGDARPFDMRMSSNFSAPSGWVDFANRSEDYGVIFLDEPFAPIAGETPFIFPFAAEDDGELIGSVLNLSGYPAGRPLHGKDSTLQWFHARTPIDVTSTTLVYDTDTGGGQSGSPVWQYDPETRERVVVGIHTNGFPGANSATRITIEMEGIFEEWRAEGL